MKTRLSWALSMGAHFCGQPVKKKVRVPAALLLGALLVRVHGVKRAVGHRGGRLGGGRGAASDAPSLLEHEPEHFEERGVAHQLRGPRLGCAGPSWPRPHLGPTPRARRKWAA